MGAVLEVLDVPSLLLDRLDATGAFALGLDLGLGLSLAEASDLDFLLAPLSLTVDVVVEYEEDLVYLCAGALPLPLPAEEADALSRPVSDELEVVRFRFPLMGSKSSSSSSSSDWSGVFTCALLFFFRLVLVCADGGEYCTGCAACGTLLAVVAVVVVAVAAECAFTFEPDKALEAVEALDRVRDMLNMVAAVNVLLLLTDRFLNAPRFSAALPTIQPDAFLGSLALSFASSSFLSIGGNTSMKVKPNASFT